MHSIRFKAKKIDNLGGVRVFLILVLLFLSLANNILAQTQNGFREKKIFSTNDTIIIDTLSLVPESIIITNKSGIVISAPDYTIINTNKIVFNKKVASDSLNIKYRTLPYDLSKPIYHKNNVLITKDASAPENPFAYIIQPTKEAVFQSDGLNKNGSISRGINFGNNQDVVVNSTLNLQLSGKLNNNIDILLAATDNNIPIQPDGNTQQLQDFDKVFIQLSDKRSKLIAGDFQLYTPKSQFLIFNKKAQGLNFSTTITTSDTNKIFTHTISAAVSRGKFARNLITGNEGNQGPYRLRGAENEPFIIILSGTEKIYIDGVLLTRGQENDYIIDYNTAEITFTPKQFITKDKRIIAEFQYSDKNYARSLYYIGNEYKTKKTTTGLHIYSEQDSKNKPLQQDLNDEQKKLLFAIGDTLSNAITSGADSVGFNSNEVLYQKKDTTIGTYTYTNIYAYSTQSENAKYRLSFSYVGENKGNYKQINSAANGRVFEWVMPDTLTQQLKGNYEPVVLLITPKQKQVIAVNSGFAISANTKLYFEAAVSNNDINTFSSKNSNDDLGFACKFSLNNSYQLSNNDTLSKKGKAVWKLNSSVNYEYLQKYFSPVERFRNIEFERDWNRPMTSIGGNQQLITVQTALLKNKERTINYEINAFNEPSFYKALKHTLNSNYNSKHFSISVNGSLLNSQTPANSTQFMRHNATLIKKFKKINIGFREMQEQNKYSNKTGDTLLNGSFDFFEWETFVQNGDTLKNKYELLYKQRNDYNPKNNLFAKATYAESISFSMGLFKKNNHKLNTAITYRKLTITDTSITIQKPDESMSGRVEYNTRLFKNAIISNTFYEIGSGLELKKEFSFIEVAPGQGSYAWTDYNSNSIKELNEFEIAVFPDQAKYIKVFTPTGNYIKTYTNQFTQLINIRPSVVWTSKKGLRKAISILSSQTAYQAGKKVTTNNPAIAFNPFVQSTDDSTLVSLNSSVRNTLYINQTGSVFGMDLSWQDARNKSLLVNGLESRTNILREARTRWNINKTWSTVIAYREGRKSNRSQFFNTRDYIIYFFETEPGLSYQPNNLFRATTKFRYSNKNNHADFGAQKAKLQDYGIEVRYNILNKGSLIAKTNFIKIIYNDASNTSIAYEMLESLKPGENFTWNISYQRTLSNNMQINLNYDGRQSPGNRPIHTGGAQVRAFF